MSRPLDWNGEGRIWPNRKASKFVQVGRARWHVQRMGSGAKVILLHGTGASCHSWRDIMPALAMDCDVIAPDLPRHAFTTGHSPEAMSLPQMANAVGHLLDEIDAEPAMLVGHSAGAPLAMQIALQRQLSVPVVGISPALKPFPGLAAQLFPAFAKLLLINPLVPRIFSGVATLSGKTERFLYRATLSRIDAVGLACYSKLFENSRHTKGALAMMANWDLPSLQRNLPTFDNPTLLIHGENDNAVPLSAVKNADAMLPNSSLEVLSGLGHLAHEEEPEQVARLIAAFAKEHGIPPA